MPMPVGAMPNHDIRHQRTVFHKPDGTKPAIHLISFHPPIGDRPGLVTAYGSVTPVIPFPPRDDMSARPVPCHVNDFMKIGGWPEAGRSGKPCTYREGLSRQTACPALPFTAATHAHAVQFLSGRDDRPQRLRHPPDLPQDKE